jgi:FkbM family methyltransferase
MLSAVTLFELVYGRLPRPEDHAVLAQVTTVQQTQGLQAALRALIAGGDQHHAPTPMALRLTAETITYAHIGNLEIALDPADVAISQPLLVGTYEPHLQRFYREHLRPGMRVVDVGANVGLYTLLAAQHVGSTGHVWAIEPVSENCRLLLLSLTRNHLTNVTLHPVACGAAAGYALLTMAMGSNASLLADTEAALLAPSCVVVPLARLDDLVPGPVDLLKLDVEGAEGLVLQGGPRLLTSRPILTTEFSLEMLARVSQISGLDYLTSLQQRGYTCWLIPRDLGPLVPIPDPETFLRTWGSPVRIEDLALLPA